MLMLLACMLTPMPQSAIAGDPNPHRVVATDAANDASDAGADLLQVDLRADSAGLHFRGAVNNIEDQGLPDQARVLFIGNSLTYTHDLPRMLQAIALQAGKRLTALPSRFPVFRRKTTTALTRPIPHSRTGITRS